MTPTARRMHQMIDADRQRMTTLADEAYQEHQEAARRLAEHNRNTDRAGAFLVALIFVTLFVLMGVLALTPATMH